MLPPNIAIQLSLKVGVIYKFSAPELITTDIEHYFIVVAIDNNENYVVVCTTQFDNRINFLNRRNLPLDTLRYLEPNEGNGLQKDSYVDCNNYHTITKNQLIQKCSDQKFKITGTLTNEEYQGVRDSIILSPLNDLPDELLNYPEN